MAETDDEAVVSWQECNGRVRKRGRVSAAALTQLDVQGGRPPAPQRLTVEELRLTPTKLDRHTPQDDDLTVV